MNFLKQASANMKKVIRSQVSPNFEIGKPTGGKPTIFQMNPGINYQNSFWLFALKLRNALIQFIIFAT